MIIPKKTEDYKRNYELEFIQSVLPDYKTPKSFASSDDYINFACNPNRLSRNITIAEYENLTRIIEQGRNSSNVEIQKMAQEYAKQLEELEALTVEDEYGITLEEFNHGNHGDRESRLATIDNQILQLQQELDDLEPKTFMEKLEDYFTYNTKKRREKISQELIILTAQRDRLLAKISYRAVLIQEAQEYNRTHPQTTK